MQESSPLTGKRIPIQKRVRRVILAIMLTMELVAVVTGVFFARQMMREGERMLSEELQQELVRTVEQKAAQAEVLLEGYEKSIAIFRDYAESLYRDPEGSIARGYYVDAPRASTLEGAYAMQSGFCSADIELNDYMDEIFFFSNLEAVLEPISKENEKEINTIYLGSETGYMVSYDRWSHIAVVPEPDVLVYDFKPSEWYSEGLRQDGIFYTGLYADSFGRGLTVTIASPFRNLEGEVQGVLAADFDITGLYDEMISMDFGKGSDSFAIGSDRKIISVDLEEAVDARDYTGLDEEELLQMTSGKVGILEKNGAFYAWAPIARVGWTLCAVTPGTLLMEKVSVIDESYRAALVVFLLLSVILLAAGWLLSRRVAGAITRPIRLLVEDMQLISDGDLDHRAVPYRNDEIGDMTVKLNEMVTRMQGTMTELVTAQDRAERMRELATRDALTGVRNKAGYDRYLRRMRREVEAGDEHFGIAVVDLNSLKFINDHYGHENGNIAIKLLCKNICEVFVHSPVFRVGGDEFAIVLRDEECEACSEHIERFLQGLERLSEEEDRQPWERISAAIGFAVFDKSIDASIEDVFTRADTAMYECKKSMKAEQE